MRRRLILLFLLLVPALFAALLTVQHLTGRKVLFQPDVSKPLAESLAAKGLSPGLPVYIRIFKEENILELWMERNGRFELALTYPICAWSCLLYTSPSPRDS